jgi:ERF superfamily
MIEGDATMKSSEQTNEISAALAKAQGAINNPGKKAENPHFKSHYADLSGGINAIRDGLSTNGIAYTQATRIEGDVLMLDTRLAHSSGQWIECEYPVCKFPVQPQIMGSCMTYARRYSLFALVGIAGEDDDGNDASRAVIPAAADITDEQTEAILEILDELDDSVTDGFKKFFKIDFVGRLPAADFSTAMKMLTKKKAQKIGEPAQ